MAPYQSKTDTGNAEWQYFQKFHRVASRAPAREPGKFVTNQVNPSQWFPGHDGWRLEGVGRESEAVQVNEGGT